MGILNKGEADQTFGDDPTPVQSEQGDLIGTHGLPVTQIASLHRIDKSETRRMIIEGIVNAPSIDAVFAPWEDVSKTDKIDRPFRVTDVAFDESTYDSTVGWYAMVFGVDVATGEEDRFSIGAENVVAQLAALTALNAFPIDVIIRKSARPTADGFYPLHLERVR